MVCSHGVAPCSSALLCVLLLVLIVTMTTGDIISNQEECLREGGTCVEKYRCPLDSRANKTGLCQEGIGSICCIGGDIITNRVECLREGGICVEKSHCPLDKRANKTGLCQEDKGAVCCNGVPGGAIPCRSHGGSCGKEDACRNVQDFGQLDCEEGEKCCLLIF